MKRGYAAFWICSTGFPRTTLLSDVMGRMDPVVFRVAFTTWATAALPNLVGEQVCVDGKAVRGSRNGTHSAAPIVSAFVGQARSSKRLPKNPMRSPYFPTCWLCSIYRVRLMRDQKLA